MVFKMSFNSYCYTFIRCTRHESSGFLKTVVQLLLLLNMLPGKEKGKLGAYSMYSVLCSGGCSSPDPLAFWACKMPRRQSWLLPGLQSSSASTQYSYLHFWTGVQVMRSPPNEHSPQTGLHSNQCQSISLLEGKTSWLGESLNIWT